MTKKLSAYCLICQTPLSIGDMDWYLKTCAQNGKDPLDTPRGGIACTTCVTRQIKEEGSDARLAQARGKPLGFVEQKMLKFADALEEIEAEERKT